MLTLLMIMVMAAIGYFIESVVVAPDPAGWLGAGIGAICAIIIRLMIAIKPNGEGGFDFDFDGFDFDGFSDGGSGFSGGDGGGGDGGGGGD